MRNAELRIKQTKHQSGKIFAEVFFYAENRGVVWGQVV